MKPDRSVGINNVKVASSTGLSTQRSTKSATTQPDQPTVTARQSAEEIGFLLAAAGIVSEQSVIEAINLSERNALPFENALIATGHVTQKDIDLAKQLLSCIEVYGIPMQVAANTLMFTKYENSTFEQAFSKASIPRQVDSFSRLGTLLQDARIISKTQYQDAIKISAETGMLLGKVLCLTGAINDSTLALALQVQGEIRRSKITKDQALAYLTPGPTPMSKLLDWRSTQGKR